MGLKDIAAFDRDLGDMVLVAVCGDPQPSAAGLNDHRHDRIVRHGDIIDKGSVDRINGYFENKCIPCDHKNMPIVGELP